MGDALRTMLPYTVGLIVSPLPVAAVILLLVSRGGLGKATAFEISWLVVSFGVVLGLAALVGTTAPHPAGGTPTWESWVSVVLGLVLIAVAYAVLRLWRRQRRAGHAMTPPHWMLALDGLSAGKVVLLAVALIVANPVNLSMLIAAGVALGQERVPGGENLAPAAAFVLIGSVTMLIPYAVTLIAGRNAGLLPSARRWLLRYNNVLTFWLTLVFGLIFLIKGLRNVI